MANEKAKDILNISSTVDFGISTSFGILKSSLSKLLKEYGVQAGKTTNP